MERTLERNTERNQDYFTCTECGREIVSIPAYDPPPTVCGLCLHLNEFIPDETERQRLRKHLMASGG
jgi:hypothetical protein